jgi:hypothetical protein
MKYEYGALEEWYKREKTSVFPEKRVPVPEIPHGLAWDFTQASVGRVGSVEENKCCVWKLARIVIFLREAKKHTEYFDGQISWYQTWELKRIHVVNIKMILQAMLSYAQEYMCY